MRSSSAILPAEPQPATVPVTKPFSRVGSQSSRAGGVRLPGFLLRDSLRNVARHCHRSLCDAVDGDECEGHLDVELAPAFVQRSSQGRTSLKLQDAMRHGVIEAAPVRRAKVVRHDQIETLTDRLLGAEPEQRRRGGSSGRSFPTDPRRSPNPQSDRECIPSVSLGCPRAALSLLLLPRRAASFRPELGRA